MVGAGGAKLAEIRGAPAYFIDRRQFKIYPRLISDSHEMQHRVAAASQRHINREGVIDSVAVNNTTRPDILRQQLHHLLAGLSRQSAAPSIDGENGAIARQAHAPHLGPPLMKMEGRFNLTAAISMPGIILSQLGMNTSASKAWASAIISTESAINSRLARLY